MNDQYDDQYVDVDFSGDEIDVVNQNGDKNDNAKTG